MKIKDMRRSDWTRIIKRDYVSEEYMTDGTRVAKSLIVIREITAPLTVSSTGKAVKIIEKDYSWLQIACEGAHWWLTAMFDEEGTLLQIYFDITAGNRFDNPENPTFRDMYLDVVVHDDGELFVLDRDELDDALEKAEITEAEHARALQDCDELCAFLRADMDAVFARCAQAQRGLKTRLSGTFKAPVY